MTDTRDKTAAIGLGITLTATAGLCALTLPFLRRFSGAPYVASTDAARRAIVAQLRQLRASRDGALRFTDLGSGSGELVLDAARCGYEARGVELNGWLVALSRCKAWRAGVGGATFRRQCLWATPLHEQDVVAVFGVPRMMGRLAEKVAAECRPGCIVASNTFLLPEPWKATKVAGGVYFYTVRASCGAADERAQQRHQQ